MIFFFSCRHTIHSSRFLGAGTGKGTGKGTGESTKSITSVAVAADNILTVEVSK